MSSNHKQDPTASTRVTLLTPSWALLGPYIITPLFLAVAPMALPVNFYNLEMSGINPSQRWRGFFCK